jgi:hypothetical protein
LKKRRRLRTSMQIQFISRRQLLLMERETQSQKREHSTFLSVTRNQTRVHTHVRWFSIFLSLFARAALVQNMHIAHKSERARARREHYPHGVYIYIN